MRLRAAFLILLLSRPCLSDAASTYASPPIRLSVVSSVRLSPEVFRLGTRLRIRNLSSGSSVIVEINAAQAYLDSGLLAQLVASPDQDWLPEFSVLSDDRGGRVSRDLPEALRGRASDLHTQQRSATRAAAPSWRILGYRVLKSPSGLLFLEVSDGVKTVFVTPEQAARRIQIRDQNALKKLFELGWRSLSIQRYDLGQEAFQRISKHARLDELQSAQMHLGLALSKYHLEGCSTSLDRHLLEADRDPGNQDDVSYYRALCAMADENFEHAELLFKKLVEKQHQNYSEASAFYLGVIAEADERFDDAEAAYLETMDFSSDSNLVAIAKARLDNVRAIRALSSLESKWISGGLSLSAAYDSNVIALPAALSPASYGLSQQSALLTTDLAFLSLAPPWSRSFSHKMTYTFLLNKHFDSTIARSYDSNIHDVGTQVQFKTHPDIAHLTSYSWNSISLGVLGSSTESLQTHTAAYTLKLMRGKNPEQPDAELHWGYRFTAIRPSQAPLLASSDLTAQGHQLLMKYLQRRNFPHVYGPELSVELRNSKGSDNSLWDAKAGVNWDYYFGKMNSPWYLSQVGSFSYKPYFDSQSNRHDYALVYVASVGRTWGASLDTRLQMQGTYNFSTLKSLYQYHQASVSLLVTAFF